MRTIIIATDFSPIAFNAAVYAAEMAITIHADLVCFHAYQVPAIFSEVPLAVDYDEFRHEAEKHMKQLTDMLAANFPDQLKLRSEISLGFFFDELKSLCEKIKPYVVVLGSQGVTAAKNLFLGSHVVYTMKHLFWPVVAVPPQSSFTSIHKIGLASDFDKVIDTTPIDEIKSLVHEFHAELHVLNIGQKDAFSPEKVFESGMLQELLNDLHPIYHIIDGENTDERILDFAENNLIDLLMVLPKRRNLIDNLIHKSHTKQLVLHSHIPVMSIHQ